MTDQASPGQIVSQAQRLAGRYHMNQSEVWKEVRKSQDKLSRNAKVDEKDKASDSSLAYYAQAAYRLPAHV